MPKKVKDEAAPLGITPAEPGRRIRGIASLSFGGNEPDEAATPMPPGYSPDSHELRFPDDGEMKADPDEGPLWIRADKRGRPAIAGPLAAAVGEYEAALLKSIGESRRKPAAVKASAAAAVSRAEKGAAVRAEVEKMTKEGKRPHTIAHLLGITAHRVRQIQADARKAEITAAEK